MSTEHFNITLAFSYHVTITPEELAAYRVHVGDPAADAFTATRFKARHLLQRDMDEEDHRVLVDDTQEIDPDLAGISDAECPDCEGDPPATNYSWIEYLQN